PEGAWQSRAVCPKSAEAPSTLLRCRSRRRGLSEFERNKWRGSSSTAQHAYRCASSCGEPRCRHRRTRRSSGQCAWIECEPYVPLEDRGRRLELFALPPPIRVPSLGTCLP